MIKKIDSSFISKTKLRIAKNKTAYLLQIAFFIVFYSIWYSVGYPAIDQSENIGTLFKVVMIGAPLLVLPLLIKNLKIVIQGEVYFIDSAVKEVIKNGERVAFFSEVENLQIRTFSNSESADSHRLSIILKDGKKIRIEELSDLTEIHAIADDMADLLQVEIIRK